MRLRKTQYEALPLEEQVYENEKDSDNILARLAARDILKMLQSLPEGYRTVFNLYVFEEMSHKEIGEVLGISENTSKSQLHRARAFMKAKLEHSS